MTRTLFDDSRVLVVAEIGNNHEGSVDVALELVQQAAAAGADAIKLQTFRTALFVRPSDTARRQRLSRFELSEHDVRRVADAARNKGLLFFSTPLDLPSARFLEPLVDAFKVASGDITFVPLLEQLAQTGKPLILSSGASHLDEIRRAIDIVRNRWKTRRAEPSLAVLHCVSSYPVPAEEASLRSIPYLRRQLDCAVGYSDHTLGIDAAVFAAVIGAVIVEKHFTLDKHQSDFRDHQLSAEPAELSELVARIRKFEAMAGREDKPLQPSEASMREAIRRSVVAVADLPAGHCLLAADVAWMRPADGLPPGEERALIGTVLNRAVQAGESLSAADVGGAPAWRGSK